MFEALLFIPVPLALNEIDDLLDVYEGAVPPMVIIASPSTEMGFDNNFAMEEIMSNTQSPVNLDIDVPIWLIYEMIPRIYVPE